MKIYKINFLLPGSGWYPVGGVRVVYQYANGLSRLGYNVTVTHGAVYRKYASPLWKLRKFINYLWRSLSGRYKPTSWLEVHPKVKIKWVPSLNYRFIPDADIIIATSWETTQWLKDFTPQKGKGIYLIQHWETWSSNHHELVESWKMPLQKVVIARWLQEIAHSLNEEAVYIPNGLDQDTFGIDNSPESRNPFIISMMFHNSSWKGSKDGLEAMQLAKEKKPQIEAHVFGVSSRSKELPSWITYHKNPLQRDLRNIYNNAAIFIAPSWTEGWGLPPCEAMLCGCAVVATDIGGHREFCIDNETALLCPPKDPKPLCDNILKLINDSELRINIAIRAYKHIRTFRWDNSINEFNRLIKQELQTISN